MRSHILLFTLVLLGFSQEPNAEPVAQVHEGKNPRLVELNPYAWEGLPIKVVISDFQESDGVFSSFICDELVKRLSTNTQESLQALNAIDKTLRIYTFKICFHPEDGVPDALINAVNQYEKEYPVLVGEIKAASNEE